MSHIHHIRPSMWHCYQHAIQTKCAKQCRCSFCFHYITRTVNCMRRFITAFVKIIRKKLFKKWNKFFLLETLERARFVKDFALLYDRRDPKKLHNENYVSNHVMIYDARDFCKNRSDHIILNLNRFINQSIMT